MCDVPAGGDGTSFEFNTNKRAHFEWADNALDFRPTCGLIRALTKQSEAAEGRRRQSHGTEHKGGHRPDPSASPPRLSFDLDKRREEVHKPASASLRFGLDTCFL